jgi:hypothetical protein
MSYSNEVAPVPGEGHIMHGPLRILQHHMKQRGVFGVLLLPVPQEEVAVLVLPEGQHTPVYGVETH